MEFTRNYNLNKPTDSNSVDIRDLNENMDILDAEVAKKLNKTDKYVHPTSHPANIIVETASKRFVSDAEKTKWNKTGTDLKSNIKIKKSVTIPASGWTEVGQYFENVISDTDITADTVVDVNIHLADLDKADDMKSSNISSNGKVTLYADKSIEEDILCDMKLVKEVI